MHRLSLTLLTLSLLLAVSTKKPPHKIIRQEGDQRILPYLVAGQMHYSRIPVEYWQHRLEMVRAMGCNAISVYIMWNYHELEKGKFDYETDNKNLKKFLTLANQLELYVLIRPGPYICAEWDFGGLPARLLVIEGMKLRSAKPIFMEEVRIYFESLVPILSPFLARNGGPIVLLQIQNEYGMYGSDLSYINALRKLWVDLGVECQQYYVDGVDTLNNSYWEGAHIGINAGTQIKHYEDARIMEMKGLIFGGEIYSGWLTHYGQTFRGRTVEDFVYFFKFLFENGLSFSMYMAHGGTNFGMTAGANGIKNDIKDYWPIITSYDYDAPINEQGAPTKKFFEFRKLAEKHVDWYIPTPPNKIPVINVGPFKTKRIASVFDNLPAPILVWTKEAKPFESDMIKMYSGGMMLYEIGIGEQTYEISISVHDYGLLFLDDKLFAVLDRSEKKIYQLSITCKSTCRLWLLVESMGHIGFDHGMDTDRKGLDAFYDKAGNWYLFNQYVIPINETVFKWQGGSSKRTYPSLSWGSFMAEVKGDTYLNMGNFKKGYVWVNGHLLGRYWSKGPITKLFCPGVWLNYDSENLVFVLQMLTDETSTIAGDKTLK